MGWRNCQSSVKLVSQINHKWPDRDKSSDGTIGDAAHASRTSDHNPWIVVAGTGVVRARDVDKDGIDAAWCVEELRKLGAAGDPRLRNRGYIIFNRRITSPDFRTWNVYKGSNPHDKHFHVSWSVDEAGFDSQAPFEFLGGAAPVHVPTPVVVGVNDAGWPTLSPGMRNSWHVKSLQGFLNWCNWRPALPLLPVTGNFLDQTKAVVMAAQRQVGAHPDGIVGPDTRRRFIQRGWDLKL